MTSPGRLLSVFRGNCARGWRAAYHDYITSPKIVTYRCPEFRRPDGRVPIHLLTGKDDWRLALWMLASFHHFTQQRWPVVVHDDGTLPAEAAAQFASCFPGTKLISRAEADAAMQRQLEKFPRCWSYRQSHPLGLKIFDMAALTKSARFLVFDSDLLFFSRPDDVLDWVESGRDDCRFIQDVAEASNVTAEQALAQLGVTLWPRVNSGLCLVTRDAIAPAFCEQVFERTAILDGHIWRVEQTLFALCASRHGRGGLLPRPYEVTLAKRGVITAVARHYVGAVRAEFFREGLPRLKSLLLETTHNTRTVS